MTIENLNRRLPMQPAPHRREGTGMALASAAPVAMLLLLTTVAIAASPTPVMWDDFNAHVWTVSLEQPADMKQVQREWIQDGNRSVFHIDYNPGEATSRYLLAFTNLLASESLDGVRELRFDLK